MKEAEKKDRKEGRGRRERGSINICVHLSFSVLQSSSFFNSNTVPLKLSFLNSDPHGENVDIIFKVC